MSKSTPPKKKTAFDVPRGTIFWFDPDELVLIEDKTHFLYDPRIEKPVTSEFVADIEERGIVQPIRVYKEDGKPLVAIGRRRVKAARAVNARRRKLGMPEEMMVRVQAQVLEGDEPAVTLAMIAENSHRRDDDPIEKAQKMNRCINMGSNIQAVAKVFGCSVDWVRKHLKLLELHNEVQKAIQTGEVSIGAALEFHALPKAEQLTALQRLRASAAPAPKQEPAAVEAPALPRTPTPLTRPPRLHAKDVAKAAGKKPTGMRTRKEIEERLQTKSLHPTYAEALRWVLRIEPTAVGKAS